MSSSLSSELRTRFREYIEEGLSGRAAAARLKLSAATCARWQRKWRETGAIAPEVQGCPAGHGKLSAHRELLEELVPCSTCKHGDKALHFKSKVTAQSNQIRQAKIQKTQPD